MPKWFMVLGIVAVAAIGMWFAFANPFGSSASDILLVRPSSEAVPQLVEGFGSSVAAPAKKNTAPAVTVVQFTPSQKQAFEKQLTRFFVGAVSSSDPAQERVYQVGQSLYRKIGVLSTTITATPVTPVTQHTNNIYSVEVRVKLIAQTGISTFEEAHTNTTLFFTLNPDKSIKKIVSPST